MQNLFKLQKTKKQNLQRILTQATNPRVECTLVVLHVKKIYFMYIFYIFLIYFLWKWAIFKLFCEKNSKKIAYLKAIFICELYFLCIFWSLVWETDYFNAIFWTSWNVWLFLHYFFNFPYEMKLFLLYFLIFDLETDYFNAIFLNVFWNPKNRLKILFFSIFGQTPK